MNDAVVGAGSALRGVALGIAAEAWRSRAAFRRERGWALSEARQRHLESVYVTVEEVRGCFREAFHAMTNSLTNGHLDPQMLAPPTLPWARLQMQINLYAPELREDARLLQEAGYAFGELLADAAIGLRKPGFDAETAKAELTESFVQRIATVDALRDRVVELAAAEVSRMHRLAGTPV